MAFLIPYGLERYVEDLLELLKFFNVNREGKPLSF
jgi:hypothetical protein